MERKLTTVAIRYEHDVVLARQRARQISALLGFDAHDQVRIATAVSEIARNVFRYAGKGDAHFSVVLGAYPQFRIRIEDHGGGIPNLQDILDGRYVSSTGMGMGIIGARRLMDDFDIQSQPGKGTRVSMAKNLARRGAPLDDKALATLSEQLARQPPQDPFEEVQRQNQELLSTLAELQRQKSELSQLNRELEDTNRGVVALYAELDERADYLRRASELKSQFLSNMSHEFRTPLNSILSLGRILLDGIDGPLNSEQQRQVRFIQRAAEDLYELVNDLLDLAKVEAGKVTVRPAAFSAFELFGALRGMLRPLLAHNSAVSLIFEDPPELPPLITDESKVSQVLRNLISNALKFTERGEVRVKVLEERKGWVAFSVADTGIGIAPRDQERIFEEFTQVEGQHQKGKTGTGLGLPLSRKLAQLLGGTLEVESQEGAGSTFTLRIPAEFKGSSETATHSPGTEELDPSRMPVLIIEDNPETMFAYQKYLKGTGFQPIGARSLAEARNALSKFRPAAIMLDILLGRENAWDLLAQLKQGAETKDIPVFVVTQVENEHKALALGATAFHPKPLDRGWLLSQLDKHVAKQTRKDILVIDDDAASRYVLTGFLSSSPYRILEAGSGAEGLAMAKNQPPAIVFLDLLMPDMDGFQVLDALKTNPSTADVPVVIHTSKTLTQSDRSRLDQRVVAVIRKKHQDRAASAKLIKGALSFAKDQRS